MAATLKLVLERLWLKGAFEGPLKGLLGAWGLLVKAVELFAVEHATKQIAHCSARPNTMLSADVCKSSLLLYICSQELWTGLRSILHILPQLLVFARNRIVTDRNRVARTSELCSKAHAAASQLLLL